MTEEEAAAAVVVDSKAVPTSLSTLVAMLKLPKLLDTTLSPVDTTTQLLVNNINSLLINKATIKVIPVLTSLGDFEETQIPQPSLLPLQPFL